MVSEAVGRLSQRLDTADLEKNKHCSAESPPGQLQSQQTRPFWLQKHTHTRRSQNAVSSYFVRVPRTHKWSKKTRNAVWSKYCCISNLRPVSASSLFFSTMHTFETSKERGIFKLRTRPTTILIPEHWTCSSVCASVIRRRSEFV